ncbi:hypothetical protein J6590_086566 [Homalodisca vitripennis]|nr:hypothetical protein J6590_086566 [Homalodisca vitripennis]
MTQPSPPRLYDFWVLLESLGYWELQASSSSHLFEHTSQGAHTSGSSHLFELTPLEAHTSGSSHL